MTLSKIKHFFAGVLLMGSLFLTTIIQAETYTVQSGDTLSDIAVAFNTTVDELAELNQITDKNLIMIGQVLNTNEAMAAATNQVVNNLVVPEPAVEETTTVEEVTTQVTTEAPVTTQVAVATTSAPQVVQAAPVAQETAPTTTAPAQENTGTGLNVSEAAAKAEIARRESGGSYTAQNGQFYGRYQLTISYLNGDLSPENQERVADAYVQNRYGSWAAALAHSNAHGWY